MLRGVAGAAAASLTVGLAGCSGGGGGADQEVYVVAFHWGFRMITPDGTVTQNLEMSEGDTLKVYGVNLEPIAEGEELDIPDAVASAAESGYEDWEHSSLERIAPQMDTTVADLEEQLEEAEEEFKDHGMAMLDPDNSQAFQVTLGGDMSAPTEETVTLDSSGSYGFTCTTYCGAGHAYMQLEDAVTVS